MGWYIGMTPEEMKNELGDAGASCSIDRPMKSSTSSTSESRSAASTTPGAKIQSRARASGDDGSVGGATRKSGNTACLLPPSSLPPPPPPDVRYIYHLCQKSNWTAAVEKNEPYFPPTYMVDGKFTRASVCRDDIVDVANEFYKTTAGEFCVLEIDCKVLYNLGIPIMAHVAPESTPKKEVKCLQIFGGISTSAPDLVRDVYHVLRKSVDGSFVKILEPSSKTKRDGKTSATNGTDGEKSRRPVNSKSESNPETAQTKCDSSNTKRKGFFGWMKRSST